MTFLQAIILGIIQGLTEFFPVSSSAHLRIARWLMGMPDTNHFLYFDLCCHAGTLLALVFYLRNEIGMVLSSIKRIGLFSLALAPLVPAYFLLAPIRAAASSPTYLGYFLIFTGLLLFLASQKKDLVCRARSGLVNLDCIDMQEDRQNALYSIFGKWKDVLCIGIMQTMALLPGISRSGATIATARILGWDWMVAARFSFLLAVPAILGGQMLETVKLIKGHEKIAEMISVDICAVGFFTALAVGMWSVRFVFWVYEQKNVRPFAWYCLGIGCITSWAMHG